MKKNIILILLLVSFLLFTTPIEAARSTIEIKIPKIPEIKIAIPSWFNSAIQPLQDSIQDLKAKVENLQNRVSEIEKKIVNLNGSQNNNDFNLPQQWNVEFFQSMEGEIPVDNPKDEELCNETSCRLIATAIIRISTPEQSSNPNNHCNWKGIPIDSAVIATMVGHLPNGDIYGAGTCREMVFRNIKSLPESGKSFEADIHLFWQGVNKSKTITITIPSRPFPLLQDDSRLKW